MKKCSKCKCDKDPINFWKSGTNGSKDGLQRWCTECCVVANREYRDKNKETLKEKARAKYLLNPEPHRAAARAVYHNDPAAAKERCRVWSANNPRKVKAHDLKKNYGVSIEVFDRLMALQGGVCAICKTVGGKKGLGLDHDHATGTTRGLLCSRCNTAIGLLRDSKELLQAAQEYLSFPTTYVPHIAKAV